MTHIKPVGLPAPADPPPAGARTVGWQLRLALIAVLIACLAQIANAQAAPDGQDPIVIGMSGAFSGTSANLGEALHSGMQAYFNQVNQQGGLDGRQLVLREYDDGYDPEPAIANTLRLVRDDRVFALMGYIGTPTVTRVLPVLQLYREDQLFLFFPFTGAQPQRQAPYLEYVYNLRPSYRQETAGLVKHLVQAGMKRIAMFYQADAYGRSGWEGVRRALEPEGLKIVAETTYARGTPYNATFMQQVEILRDAQPDVIISISAKQAAAGFIRDARDAGWDVPIANVSFVDSDSLLELLLAAGRDSPVDYTRNLINSEVVPNYLDATHSAAIEFRELMAASGFAKPGFVSFEGFLNAKLLVEVLRRMNGDIRREHIRPIMDAMSGYDIGLEEPVVFGPNRNQGLQNVYYNRVENGRFTTIEDWSQWKTDVETF